VKRAPLQLVHATAGEPDGVVDFARTLERAAGGGPALALATARDPQSVRRRLAEADALLLHYSGYGFSKRGIPRGLVREVVRWRRGGGQRRLVTLFHEVHATARAPWRSSFWLAPLQRSLARRLHVASDVSVTSVELYARRLRALAPGRGVELLPVLSTVGERDARPPLGERERTLVIFGRPGLRRAVWSGDPKLLERWLDGLRPERVDDVGPGDGGAPAEIRGVRVVRSGHLEPTAISALLARSSYGAVPHRPALLGKSTVFAAFCAHGLAPICFGVPLPAEAGLVEPPHGASTGNAPTDAELERIAGAAARWYDGHRRSVQVERYAAWLGE
jgi:hypothetical protein